MPKRVIIRPGQVHPLVAATIPNLEIVNTGVTVDDQEKYNKYVQAVQLAQMRQDAAKHGNKPTAEIKEDHSDWARAHTFEQNNPKLSKAVQFVPVANTIFNTMKSGGTRPEKLNVGKAVVSDAMALAGLGMATKAFGPTTAIVSDIGGTAGAYAGNELGEHLVETGKISPEAGIYAVPGLTWLGGSLGAGTAFKTYRGWQRALEPDIPVVKQEYSNWGGEFVDDVAVNSRQHYLPKKSKLSVDELAGIPKGERMVESPEYLELKRVYNEFANKYNYPEAKSKNYEELVRESRKLINRHNTFLRGVEDSERLRNALPNSSLEQRLRYAATYNKDNSVWVAPGTSNAFDYGGGTAELVRRSKISFDGEPITWFNKNDYIVKNIRNSSITPEDIVMRYARMHLGIDAKTYNELREIMGAENYARLINVAAYNSQFKPREKGIMNPWPSSTSNELTIGINEPLNWVGRVKFEDPWKVRTTIKRHLK